MTKTNKLAVLVIFFGIFTFSLFTTNLLPLVIANESPGAFTSTSGISGDLNNTIDNYVLKGAGYFLNGYGDILRFMNIIELAKLEGPQYDLLTKSIAEAVVNMENANSTYTALVQEAAQTPYNQAVILELALFDYNRFMRKNNLNPFIFKKVEKYLRSGNIRGIYLYLQKAVENILPVLYRVKTEIQSGNSPAAADVWLLGQTCSETLLFGQYTAQIFYEIK